MVVEGESLSDFDKSKVQDSWQRNCAMKFDMKCRTI
jgi:hypothetical protein